MPQEYVSNMWRKKKLIDHQNDFTFDPVLAVQAVVFLWLVAKQREEADDTNEESRKKKIGSRKNQEMEQTETDGVLTSKNILFLWRTLHNDTEREIITQKLEIPSNQIPMKFKRII